MASICRKDTGVIGARSLAAVLGLLAAPIVVTSINAAAPISIANGSYQINGGFLHGDTWDHSSGAERVIHVYATAKPATTRQASAVPTY